jgi:hypothetical protein
VLEAANVFCGEVFWREGRDKVRINVGVKWVEMTSDRTNISFTRKKNNFPYRNCVGKGR